MRSLIVSEFITLDGVVEAPGGEPIHPHAGWTIPLGVPESRRPSKPSPCFSDGVRTRDSRRPGRTGTASSPTR